MKWQGGFVSPSTIYSEYLFTDLVKEKAHLVDIIALVLGLATFFCSPDSHTVKLSRSLVDDKYASFVSTNRKMVNALCFESTTTGQMSGETAESQRERGERGERRKNEQNSGQMGILRERSEGGKRG